MQFLSVRVICQEWYSRSVNAAAPTK